MPEILVEFDRSTQSIGALREAAYRIVREASCQIDAAGDGYLCRLTPKQGRVRPLERACASISWTLLRMKTLGRRLQRRPAAFEM
jgi:hypothetical protein